MRFTTYVIVIILFIALVSCHQETQKEQPRKSLKNEHEQFAKSEASMLKNDLTVFKSDLMETLLQEPAESLEYQSLRRSSLKGQSIHDFGVVPAGAEVQHEFTLRNIGQESLIVSDIDSGCRCTTGLASEGEVYPNENLRVLVKFQTPIKHGSEQQEIVVHLTGKESGKQYFPAQLMMKGKLIMPLEAIPNQLVFGKILHGEERIREISILQRSNERILLNQVSAGSEYVEAKIFSTEADGNIRVQVSLLPNAPIGNLKVNLNLTYQYKEEFSNLEIPVFATVLGDLEVLPKHLFFGIVRNADGAKKRAEVKILGNRKIHVKSVKAQSKYVKAMLTAIHQGKKYTIQTEILADAPVGELRDTVIVFTDSPVQPQIEIPLYAQVR